MAQTEKNVLEITRVGDEGEITLPSSYRNAEHLGPGAVVAIVQVGDALVLAPVDDEFASVVDRLESALQAAGASIDDVIAAASIARGEIVLEEFGSDLHLVPREWESRAPTSGDAQYLAAGSGNNQ